VPIVRVALLGFFALAASGQDSPAPSYLSATPSSVPDSNLHYYLKQTFGPSAYLGAGVAAGWTQWRNSPPEWGQGGDGFERRLASAYARRVIRNSLDLGVASLRGEVLRYDHCECSGFGPRTGHAFKRTFVRRTEDGGQTFALGRFVGAYGSGFLSNTWYPDSRNDFRHGLARGSTTLGIELGRNVFREFWPDIKHKLLRR
jgi:hypothetical protein